MTDFTNCPDPPPHVSRFSLTWALTLAAGAALLTFILWPVTSGGGPVSKSSVSRSHLSQLGLAIEMYCEENSGRLPLATSWCDACEPYAKSSIFDDPYDESRYGYAMNHALSGRQRDALVNTSGVIVFYSSHQKHRNSFGGAEDLRRTKGKNFFTFANCSARGVRWDNVGGLVWSPQVASRNFSQ